MFSKTFSRGKIFEDAGFSFTCGRTKTEVFENNDVIYHLLLALRFHCLTFSMYGRKRFEYATCERVYFWKRSKKISVFKNIQICVNGAFVAELPLSLTWSASMLIFWNKRKFLHKKRVQLPQDCWDTNMAAVSLFWNTNMAAVTSCENARLQRKNSLVWDTNTRQIRNGKESGLS